MILKMSSENVNQLQLMQQNMQNILMQKQQIESQLTELNSALSEIEKTNKAYKILGKVMIAADKEEVKKELQEKKEVFDLRFKNIVAQEEKFKENIENIQQKVVEELKDGK